MPNNLLKKHRLADDFRHKVAVIIDDPLHAKLLWENIILLHIRSYPDTRSWGRQMKSHHDDVMTSRFLHYWPFMRGIHRLPPEDSPHKGPVIHTFVVSLIVVQKNNCWTNTRVASDLRHQGVVSIRKTVLPGMVIPMLKIRRPNGRLIFNMEIAICR